MEEVSIPSVRLPKGFSSEPIEMLVSGVRGLQELQLESPDVETPGLLVKALISSFFMIRGGRPPKQLSS